MMAYNLFIRRLTALFWQWPGPAAHLKVSMLTGLPSYHAYIDEAWRQITESQFEYLLGSGHFCKHKAASSAEEVIYNRIRVKIGRS